MSKGKKLNSKEMAVGTFIANARGFGFVAVEGMEEDLYIPEEYVHGAFNGDTVEVELLSENTGRRREARIRHIIMRGIEELVGTYQAEKNFGFVIPDDIRIQNDIFIPIEHSNKAVSGDKVVVKITDYGSIADRKKPEGKIKEIIGNINDPGVDILSIVKNYNIPYEFPEKVINQANKCPDSISEADMLGRKDLRDVTMVTIDGEDAKDLDDAVSLSIDEEGLYHLGVHIADVSNYVQERSALDREALKRGTSVYLVDRVIPMLPHRLSNGICSLNMKEDRLALSCLMVIDSTGNVVDHEIAETVINVNERMSYTSVAKILEDKDKEEIEKYKDLVPMFKDMKKLSAILRKKREKKGAIDFDFPENKIIVDKDGNPVDIVPRPRNVATKLIEDFMLAANQTVAEHFFYLQSPFVYRVHQQPDPEKIATLSAFVGNLGHHIKIRKDSGVNPKEIQKLLKNIEGCKEEAVISRMTLRSMMHAKYSTECTGHFGLAFDYYCHFTSPIRRYPDLQIHRIIKDHLRGRMNEGRIEHYQQILDEVAGISSETEKKAEEIERETDRLKKAQFMEKHVGECFEGVVSGVTAWGLFVELENTCEGLIRAASMSDDFYIYDETNMKLIGERTHKEYVLGQKVFVKVLGADRLTKSIDFRIVDSLLGDDQEEMGYDPEDFVVYSEVRKVSENRANKVRKLLEAPKKNKDDEKSSKSGRKVYKVHKYKKSATSKAARSAQGKSKRKKR